MFPGYNGSPSTPLARGAEDVGIFSLGAALTLTRKSATAPFPSSVNK